MSGSYSDVSVTTADAAAIAAQLAPAVAIFEARQAQAQRFITEHGAAVNNGHSPVGDVPASLGGV